MAERIQTKILNPYEIKRELEHIYKNSKRLDISIGLDNLTGKILQLREKEIYLDISGDAKDYFNDRNYIYVFANVSTEVQKIYYNFDVEIVTIQAEKKFIDQKYYFWIVKYPEEIRKSTARAVRVKPYVPLYLEIPDFSTSALKSDASLFVHIPELFFSIKEIDKYILLSDEFDAREVFNMIRKQLLRYTNSSDRFSFLLKDQTSLDTIKELWLENTQSESLPETEREYYKNKNIGSIVIAPIKNQLNQLEGYIIVTTPLEAKGLAIIEKDYIKALGARILAAYKRHKKIETKFLVKDISEEGVAIIGKEADFACLSRGDILRDVRINLDSGLVKVNIELVRKFGDIAAFRLTYPDYTARLKIRKFIELCLYA